MKINAEITLQILLKDLNCKYEESRLTEKNPAFSKFRLYTDQNKLCPCPDCLEVGMLSEILDKAPVCPQVSFLCIRDRFADEQEAETPAGNIIILKTNQKLPSLFNRISEIFSHYRDWIEAMALSAASNEGFQQLLDLSEPVIGNHIDIMDATFKLLAWTQDISIDDPITESLLKNGYHSSETIDQFNSLRRFEEYDREDGIIISDDYKLCKYITVKRVFHANGRPSFYVVMHCNHEKPDSALLDLFRILLSYIGHYANLDFQHPSTFAAAQRYILDLLDGSIHSIDEAIARASHATIPFHQDYILYQAAFTDNFNTPLDNLALTVNRVLVSSYAIPYRRRLVVIYNYHRGKKKETLLAARESLATILEKFSCFIGISNSFENLWQARGALEQAGCAIDYGILKSRNSDAAMAPVSFFSFEESFLTLLAAKSFNSSPDLFRHCDMLQNIRKIRQYDKEHNSSLSETLEVFLRCHNRATKAGEILHVHRNTVLYHIERIEDLLEISLDDMDACIKLLIGLELYNTNMIQMLRVTEGDPSV